MTTGVKQVGRHIRASDVTTKQQRRWAFYYIYLWQKTQREEMNAMQDTKTGRFSGDDFPPQARPITTMWV